ncbi:MAG: nucleotidyl transferase AbiEii/AbiGii toxin family protein [Planctomycetota bacterium]
MAELTSARDRASIPYMLVGGLAVLVHGDPRLTRDIDVTISLAPAETLRLVEALGTGFRPLAPDPPTFVEETRVLPVEGPDGTRADVIFAGLPFEEDAIRRARVERLGGLEVRVCTPEDLIVHKIVSERSKDREDVAGILARSGPRMDLGRLDRLIESLARELEHPTMLAFWRGLREGR